MAYAAEPGRYTATVLDHIAVQCTDVSRSRAFYERLLGAIGITPMDFGTDVVGFTDSHMPFFWLGPGGGAELRELHVAFRVADRAQVRAFHQAAVDLGVEILHEPREFPEYHPDYYAVFVRDPDGHNVEAVCHRPKSES